MQWQYKTVLVEFQKDGILGEKYIDEEESEALLNEAGRRGWELVSAVLVPEGMLFFCKRAVLPGQQGASEPDLEEIEATEAVELPEDGAGLGSIKIF